MHSIMETLDVQRRPLRTARLELYLCCINPLVFNAKYWYKVFLVIARNGARQAHNMCVFGGIDFAVLSGLGRR